MGEGTPGLNGPERTPRDVEAEIDEVRDDLDALVSELDRRRHEALDWRLQVRRHQRGIAIAVGSTAAVVVAIVLVQRSLRRRRESPTRRAATLLHALQLVAREPEAFERALEAQRSHPGRTAMRAAGSAGGGLVRAGLARALQTPGA
jgi:hypothetical protein